MPQGWIYGLIAVGFVLIYKATETVSFAQGDLMMVGAFGGLLTMTLLGFPFWVSVPAAIIGMALFGIGLERMVIRPILGQPAFSIVMLTIGVGYTARGLITMIPEIGTETNALGVPYRGQVVKLGEAVIKEVERLLPDLPTRENAGKAWADLAAYLGPDRDGAGVEDPNDEEGSLLREHLERVRQLAAAPN